MCNDETFIHFLVIRYYEKALIRVQTFLNLLCASMQKDTNLLATHTVAAEHKLLVAIEPGHELLVTMKAGQELIISVVVKYKELVVIRVDVVCKILVAVEIENKYEVIQHCN